MEFPKDDKEKGIKIEYTLELECIAIKMDSGKTYDQALQEYTFENREIILFEGM